MPGYWVWKREHRRRGWKSHGRDHGKEDGIHNPTQYIKIINQQIREYNLLHAQLVLVAEKNNYVANIISSLSNENLTPEPFYHQDRITEWYRAGSTEHLIEANEAVLHKMKKTLLIQ